MNRLLRAGAATLVIFGGASLAAAQSARPDLTPNQQHTISQGLASSPSQSAPSDTQPRVGSKVPDSMNAQALPSNVTDQVPEAKTLFFVKLPDRIMLIDPETKMVTQIVADTDSTTTGSSTNSPGSSGSNQPSR